MHSLFCLRQLVGVCVVGLASIGCGQLSAIAQTTSVSTPSTTKSADASKDFPSDPAMWVNSDPISMAALKGKGAFVWFYEEGCPRCREKWPEMLATAKKYEGKPVVFIAVNSGTSRDEVQNYAQSTGLDWPILVDTSREFEKQSGVDEISLQNIYQCRIITAKGRMVPGNFADMEGSIKTALQGAEWKVDPAEVPDSLKKAWLGVETGNYADVGATIRKSLNSLKPDVKSAAEKLNSVAQNEIAEQVAVAKAAREEGNKWNAYLAYAGVTERFQGFEIPSEVLSAKKELSTDAQVKAGLLAIKSLENARKLVDSGKPVTQKRAIPMLEKIIKDLPGTDLATSAQALLNEVMGK
jgi:thiol-disulfide isomerase/thioredoxin